MNRRTALIVLAFLTGVCNNLPSFFYVGGVGLFEILTVFFFIYFHYKGELPFRFSFFSFKAVVIPIIIIVYSFLQANIFGVIKFKNYSILDIMEPFRMVFYILFIVLISNICKTSSDLYAALFSFIMGVLLIVSQSYLMPGEASFLYGLPVLFNPNVMANMLGYALISIALLAKSSYRKVCIPLIFVFTFFLFLCFSKAGWVMMLLGWILIMLTYKTRILYIILVLFFVHVLFVHYNVYFILQEAIDLKLNASVGGENEVGSFNARYGFLESSIMTVLQYPLGIGNYYFSQIHDTHASELGALYIESESPHSAIGYLLISSGFIGFTSFLVLLFRGVFVLGTISGRKGVVKFLINSLVLLIFLLSTFFQIELFSQPFLYMVLGFYCAIARWQFFEVKKNG